MNKIILNIIIFFWKLLIRLPRSFQIKISKILGVIIWALPFNRNKYSKINIESCLKDFSNQKKIQIYRQNIIASGRIIFDTGISWFWSNKKINQSIDYKMIGEERILKEQQRKNGVLLIFKHSLHLELDARLIGMNIEAYGVERSHNSKVFNDIQSAGRNKSLLGSADRREPIKFIRWLKNGKTVLYAPDQDYGNKNSITVNFFGLPAATIKAPYKILKSTKCKLYFVNSYIKKGKYFLEFEKLNLNESSEKEFLEELNIFIESKIRKHPHEYLWQHRRFKSTLGKENFYGK